MYSFKLSFALPVLAALFAAAAPAVSNTSILAADPAAVEDSKGFDYCKYENEPNPKGNIRNDLLNGHCKGKKVLLLWGRGSEEPENMGPRVGLPLSVALAKMLGDKNVAVQGVYKYDGFKYPAILQQGYNGGSKSGSQAMAHLIAKWKNTCPETRLVIGGYSQGAQITHNAVYDLEDDSSLNGKNLQKDIHGFILVGDPDKTASPQFPGVPHLESKKIELCHKEDGYCHGLGTYNPAHITYCKNIHDLAVHAIDKFNLKK